MAVCDILNSKEAHNYGYWIIQHARIDTSSIEVASVQSLYFWGQYTADMKCDNRSRGR